MLYMMRISKLCTTKYYSLWPSRLTFVLFQFTVSTLGQHRLNRLTFILLLCLGSHSMGSL